MTKKLIVIGCMAAMLAGGLSAEKLVTGSDIAAAGYGAAGAEEYGSNWTVEQMLQYAIEDEYLARAEYVAIMREFRITRPFSNIKQAEDQHISMLVPLFETRGISIPSDTAIEHIFVPPSLSEAFQTGVQAELDNIAMYDAFLESPLLQVEENSDVVDAFIRLKRASESHLAAFQKQLN